MRPSLFLKAQHYQPMIKFIGQRSKIPHETHAPAPHPAAPKEIVEHFQDFLGKLQSTSHGSQSSSSAPKTETSSSSSKGSSKPVDFEDFWEAPRSLWQIKELSEREIEAVMGRAKLMSHEQSGGATDIRSGP